MTKDTSSIRTDYSKKVLSKNDVLPDPIEQFNQWFEEALKAEVVEANAMNLSTVNSTGQPSGRMVLLKGVDWGGFLFYTNYESRKGKDLTTQPFAALTFFWNELERQIRIEGRVHRLDPAASTAYFDSRPHGSKIGAIVSPQSQPIESQEWLQAQTNAMTEELGDKQPVRPAHWGGYILIPHYMEFWQGRVNRLHDRICYSFENENWKLERLAP